jgi:uncharacterized protein (TIGR02145 family)
MAGIVFDITFTPGVSAVGGSLEYRAVTPRTNGPSAQVPYPWQTALSLGVFNGYFPFTTSPIVLTNVAGNLPDFQPNTAYEFRVKQLCPDGTEPYSDVDGTYWVPECVDFTTSIEIIPIQQGSFGIGVTWKFPPGSSLQTYTLNLYNFQNNIIGTATINSSQLDQLTGNPYTYIFTDSNISVPPLQPGISYSVEMIPSIQTVSEPAPSVVVPVNACARSPIKGPTCSSFIIETGDQWGIEWYDCTGDLLNCYSNQPYLNNVIRICSLGPPRTYYCDGANFVDGYVEDSGGTVTNGGRVTLVAQDVCLNGYSDFSTGLTDPNGVPINCIPNPTCGASNIIIQSRCMAPTDFDGTTFRNGDSIPEISDPAQWSTMTSPAWCWVNNQVGSPYGKLYNWYAVMDSRNIAPSGYHVPTAAEWAAWVQDMINAGKSPNDLRVTGDVYWNNNLGATDFYGYGAYGSGRRYLNGTTLNFKTSKWYWVDNSIAPAVSQWAYVIFTSNPPAGPGYAFHPATFPATTLDSLQGMSLRLFCD